MAVKEQRKQTLITVILLVLVVFAIGVILGNSYRSIEASDVGKLLRSSELDADSFLIEQELFESFETNCEFASKRVNSLSTELWSLGKTLGQPDAKARLGNSDFNLLKRKFHLMQIRTFVLEKQLRDDCDSKTDVILYYFKRDDPLSAMQGEVLDNLVADFDLHVYAIELNYSRELNFLEEYFGVEEAPTLIVNFTEPVNGFVTREQLEPMIYG